MEAGRPSRLRLASDPSVPQITKSKSAMLLREKHAAIIIDAYRRFCANLAHMKTEIAAVVTAILFAAAAACFAANPQMGTWKLNEAKSKLAPGMGKNTLVVYAEQGDKVKVTVEGVDKDGKPRHGVWIGKFDGKAYPSKGNLAWNAAAYKMVDERTNDITTMKDGKVMWTGRIEVSKDGKSRTVTVHGTNENGKKYTSTVVYDKA
jgi:hypothetical protein